MERRDEITADTSYYIYDTPGDNDDMNDEQQINDILFGSHHQTHVNSNEIWSLQKPLKQRLENFWINSKRSTIGSVGWICIWTRGNRNYLANT
ncbi:unnamed protein product, partial [Rotaria magnacalcarata]